jgi:hypothetical protein
MPQVGFEPTIPVFERAMTVHGFDHGTTVIGYRFETSRLSHFLDNRFTDGGQVASLKRRPPFTPQEDSWYSFLLEAELTPGP